eukprot:CAMPEP_0185032364 /NCGR_PEP_ID=MMETSP1103-20130426/20364_1 /TAXON_ID=36769 /ORGANISM="Paraphysomonas bandaiensis, Strain Caron Lab Isolate" /LENGTH=921 /DNA_ID=CAMNT_0027568231 /DNA_START=618 /DNA_END=3383 /DNA_ORIENTATION=+
MNNAVNVEATVMRSEGMAPPIPIEEREEAGTPPTPLLVLTGIAWVWMVLVGHVKAVMERPLPVSSFISSFFLSLAPLLYSSPLASMWVRTSSLRDMSITAAYLCEKADLLSRCLSSCRHVTGTRHSCATSTRQQHWVDLCSRVWFISIDLCLGLAAAILLWYYRLSLLSFVHNVGGWTQRETILWPLEMLNHNPYGMKFNPMLTDRMSSVLAGAVKAISNFYSIIQEPFEYSAILLLCCVGSLGISVQLVLAVDLIRLLTMHIALVHRVLSLLHHFQVTTLLSLLHLFQGKKKNVLRNRVDTLDCNHHQLFCGIVLFSVIFFLFPTLAAYYYLFTVLQLGVVVCQAFLWSLTISLKEFAWYEVYKAITDPVFLSRGLYLNVSPARGGKDKRRSYEKGSVAKNRRRKLTNAHVAATLSGRSSGSSRDSVGHIHVSSSSVDSSPSLLSRPVSPSRVRFSDNVMRVPAPQIQDSDSGAEAEGMSSLHPVVGVGFHTVWTEGWGGLLDENSSTKPTSVVTEIDQTEELASPARSSASSLFLHGDGDDDPRNTLEDLVIPPHSSSESAVKEDDYLNSPVTVASYQARKMKFAFPPAVSSQRRSRERLAIERIQGRRSDPIEHSHHRRQRKEEKSHNSRGRSMSTADTSVSSSPSPPPRRGYAESSTTHFSLHPRPVSVISLALRPFLPYMKYWMRRGPAMQVIRGVIYGHPALDLQIIRASLEISSVSGTDNEVHLLRGEILSPLGGSFADTGYTADAGHTAVVGHGLSSSDSAGELRAVSSRNRPTPEDTPLRSYHSAQNRQRIACAHLGTDWEADVSRCQRFDLRNGGIVWNVLMDIHSDVYCNKKSTGHGKMVVEEMLLVIIMVTLSICSFFFLCAISVLIFVCARYISENSSGLLSLSLITQVETRDATSKLTALLAQISRR